MFGCFELRWPQVVMAFLSWATYVLHRKLQKDAKVQSGANL